MTTQSARLRESSESFGVLAVVILMAIFFSPVLLGNAAVDLSAHISQAPTPLGPAPSSLLPTVPPSAGIAQALGMP